MLDRWGQNSTTKPASQNKLSSRVRGRQCEEVVCLRLQRAGWLIEARNLKTVFGEIDILALGPNQRLVIFEVKSVTSAAFSPYRLSSRQKGRLARALQWVSEERKCEVSLSLVLVKSPSEMRVLGWDEL